MPLAVGRAGRADGVVAEGVRAALHPVAAPPGRVTTPAAAAAPPVSVQILETACPAGALG